MLLDVFFMLCRIDCLCGCCATPPVSEASLSTSPRVRPLGITRGYAWCVPRWGQWVRTGRFLFSLPLHFSTSPLLHFSTGSPFGHHPRLSMVCPRWGQWVNTWSILRGLSSAHHEMSMYLSVDTLSHAPTTAAANMDNASRGGAPCITAGDTRAISEGEPVGKWTEDTPTPAASH